MAVAKNRIFRLKEHEFDKVIKASADTLNVAPGHARLREGAILDLSECFHVKALNLVDADLGRAEKILFPAGMGSVNCMGTVFPENFVMDLTKAYRLSKINVYHAKNLKEIIISDKISPHTFFGMMQDFPDNCDIVVRRANGEIGTKSKKAGEYIGADTELFNSFVIKGYLKENNR